MSAHGIPASSTATAWLVAAAWLLLGAVCAAAPAPTPDNSPVLENYRVVRWTTGQGLPQNTVNDVVILPDGEMWLATFGGLARFDGAAFKVLDIASAAGLPANRIVALVPETGNSFLFLTQQGHLGRVTDGQPALLIPPPAASVDFLDLIVRSPGDAYARSAPGGVWHTDLVHGWQRVLGGRPEPLLMSFAADATGGIWGLWVDGLTRADRSRREGLVPVAVGRVVAAGHDGGLWIGAGATVEGFDDGHLTPLTIQPTLARDVNTLDVVDDDHLWVAAGTVISRLDRQPDGTWRRSRLPVDLPTGFHVVSLHHEADGTLWIGSDGAGLYRANPLPATRYGFGATRRGVGAVAPDGADGVLIVTGCVSVEHLDGAGVRQPVPFRSIIGNHPLAGCGVSLSPGLAGSVWVRAGRNLVRYRNGAKDGELITGELPWEEGPVVAAADGTVWVISRGGLVQRFATDGSLAGQISLPAPLMTASAGPDGSLWVGGDGVVYRVTDGRSQSFRSPAEMVRGLVRAIVAEPDGTVWVGSYGGGIGRLRNGAVAGLTMDQGLPDNSVSAILVDRRDRMWISTNRGIAIVPRQVLNDVADGRLKNASPIVLGGERGIPEANFGSPAAAVDAAGRFWFGTIDGAVTIDPGSFPHNTVPLSVNFDEARADDHPLPVGPVITVPALTTRLRIGFTVFELLYSDQIRFRYRFEGLDPDWIDANGDRYLEWTPSPGRHRLLVEARNEDGVWSSAPAVLTIDVLPAWWQTVAFRAALGLVVVLAAVAAYRLRVRRIERRHAQELRAVSERQAADERLASTRLQLEHVARAAVAGELAASIAHEVRQPIGAIVNNAEAGRRNLSQYLGHPGELELLFDDIVADAMRASEVVQGLRGFLQATGPAAAPIDLSELVREVLPLVRLELRDYGVRVELELAVGLPPVEGLRVQLGQVVINLVTNACEALAGVRGDRRVIISTMVRDGRVELTVADNGPGLSEEIAAKVFEPFVTTKPDGLGVGLAISRSIAERHGGHLSASPGPDGGLVMTLSLPAAPGSGGPE